LYSDKVGPWRLCRNRRHFGVVLQEARAYTQTALSLASVYVLLRALIFRQRQSWQPGSPGGSGCCGRVGGITVALLASPSIFLSCHLRPHPGRRDVALETS
jgi:hypothetical protein